MVMETSVRPQHLLVAALLFFAMGPNALVVILVAFMMYRSHLRDANNNAPNQRNNGTNSSSNRGTQVGVSAELENILKYSFDVVCVCVCRVDHRMADPSIPSTTNRFLER